MFFGHLASIIEHCQLLAIKRNPKYFFTYVKKFSKSKPSVGPLRNADGKFVVDSKEMAELLSMQYSSVFSTPFSEPLNPDETFKQTAASNLISLSTKMILSSQMQLLVQMVFQLSS